MDRSDPQTLVYRAEPADQRIVRPLDSMTLIYQRRSGITHIVAEPVPQILEAMRSDLCDVALVVARLTTLFDLGEAAEAKTLIAERLVELAELGLVEAIYA